MLSRTGRARARAAPACHAHARRAARLLGARRPPPLLFALGLAIAVAAALPALYLVVVVAGDSAIAADAVLTSRALGLVVRSAGLAAAVTAGTIAIAVPLAWLTVRSDLPGRRGWATLATLPLVMPSYIGGLRVRRGAAPEGPAAGAARAARRQRAAADLRLRRSMARPHAVHVPARADPVRAALRRLDPALEEAARVMGRPPLEVFRTVVLPQLAPAIGAGGVLVALYVLSDFGAVAILRFDSFTRETTSRFRRRSGRRRRRSAWSSSSSCSRCSRCTRRARGARPASHEPRYAAPARSGAARALALAGTRVLRGLVAVTLVLPVGVLVYWATQDLSTGFDASTVAANAANSLIAAACAALAAGAAAIVVAVLSVRFPGYATRAIERFGYAGYALPGIVVALALVFFGTRVALPLYQTLAMLVFALSIHYLPLAVGPISGALLQVPPRLEEAARGLGRTPLQVFRTITRPLVTSGVLAGAALVFLHALKELPATLLLAPIGFDTLATDIFRQTTTGFFEAGAIPALILLLIAAPPLYLLNEKSVTSS